MVTEARDIIDAITPMLAQPPPPLPQPGLAELVAGEPDAPPESDRGRIYEALGPTPVEVDEIIRFTQLPARIVQMVLLEFELAGRVERHPGQRVSTR